MDVIKKIINELYKSVSCPVCKKKYDSGGIKLRGKVLNNFFLEAICGKNHEPATTMIIVKYENKITNLKNNKSNNIKIKDKYLLRIYLNNFQGDFSSIFNGRQK